MLGSAFGIASAISTEMYIQAQRERLAEKLRQQKLEAQMFKLKLLAAYPPKPKCTKCPSCGSREFRQHAGRSVCSYCRSEG